MRNVISQMLRTVNRIFVGTGVGKIPLIMKIYDFLYSYLKSGDIVLIKVQGHKMYIDMSDLKVSKELFMTGIHEKYVTKLFKRIVREGMTVVDLGAHIGYYTLLAAKLVGKNGKVFAFEPAPTNYSLLVKNIEANGYNNVIPVNKAVSNKIGTSKLFLAPDNTSGHKLWNSYNSRESIDIEVTTLDEFFGNYDTKIDIIKMDIEGGEMAALQGMDNIIRRNSDLKIITEFWPKGIEGMGFSPTDFLNKLIEYGFKLYHINKQGVEPADPACLIEICEKEGSINIYCEMVR